MSRDEDASAASNAWGDWDSAPAGASGGPRATHEVVARVVDTRQILRREICAMEARSTTAALSVGDALSRAMEMITGRDATSAKVRATLLEAVGHLQFQDLVVQNMRAMDDQLEALETYVVIWYGLDHEVESPLSTGMMLGEPSDPLGPGDRAAGEPWVFEPTG